MARVGPFRPSWRSTAPAFTSVPRRASPRGIHLVFLPPYSPELQPAEHLWRFCDKPLVNARVATFDDLEDALAAQRYHLRRQPDVIFSAAAFHRWIAA